MWKAGGTKKCTLFYGALWRSKSFKLSIEFIGTGKFDWIYSFPLSRGRKTQGWHCCIMNGWPGVSVRLIWPRLPLSTRQPPSSASWCLKFLPPRSLSFSVCSQLHPPPSVLGLLTPIPTTNHQLIYDGSTPGKPVFRLISHNSLSKRHYEGSSAQATRRGIRPSGRQISASISVPYRWKYRQFEWTVSEFRRFWAT